VKRSLALVSVAGLFLLGILIGALGMHLYYATKFPGPPGFGPRGHRPGGPFMGERLERELGLSVEQKQRIDEIIRESRVEGEALREEMFPRVHAQMERTRERIMEVLTPEQREKFEELRHRHRGRADRFFLGR